MIKIIAGIIFIFLFFFGLLNVLAGGKSGLTTYLLGGSIMFLIPATLLIYFGFRSRKMKHKMPFKRITTKEGEVYFVDVKSDQHVKSDMDIIEHNIQLDEPPKKKEAQLNANPNAKYMAITKLRVSFWKPIIDEAKDDKQVVCSWEPDTFGWIGVEDDALVIFGSSRHSFMEKWLSLGPFGKVFIQTLFSTIRQKARRVPYQSISKIVAATRPHRSSFWDGGDTKCGIIHILINESGKPPEVCAFSTSGTNADLSSFWNSCSIRLGAEKLDIRDEAMRIILLSQPSRAIVEKPRSVKAPFDSSTPMKQDRYEVMREGERVKCGVPVPDGSHTLKSKNKTAAVLLAVFLGFWTWCYTYKKDAWKFWLNLGLSVVSIGYWLPVAWIWAIVDAARRPKEFYTNFNQLVLGQASSIPTQAMPPLISQQRSVENEGQVSTNIAGAASGARNVVTPAATQEIVLATIVRVSDVLWGGFLSLHLTNRRIIVESVVGTGATVAATLAGGIVGTLIADNIATKKAQKLISEDRSIDQILGSTTKNYTLNYDDISDIVLKRKALPIGCSRCKIQSKQKNVTFAFKRAMFDDVSAMFGRILPGKTTFK